MKAFVVKNGNQNFEINSTSNSEIKHIAIEVDECEFEITDTNASEFPKIGDIVAVNGVTMNCIVTALN